MQRLPRKDDWIVFKDNPNSNIIVYWRPHPDNSELVQVKHVTRSEDPRIKLYKDNEVQRDKNISWGDGAVAARIDPATMTHLMLSGAAEDGDYMKKFLNSSENKNLRTMKGKI